MSYGEGLGDEFKRQPIKFLFGGIDQSKPANMLDVGRYPFVKNVRSYVDSALGTRPGLTALSDGYVAIHSIFRLNDIPRLNDYTYIVVDNDTLKFGKTTLAAIETGYSGHPVCAVEARPERSPSPLLYIADLNQMRKCNVLGQANQWGIFPPKVAPSVVLSPAAVTSITDCTSNNPEVTPENGNVWNKSVNATTMTQVNRTNTTIGSILYDIGSTGYCNIAPAAMGTDIQPGQRILVAAAEYVVVEQTFPAIVSTTIESIAYVSGVAGECVIQLATPITGLVANTLVRLNATENVRVLSVTNGPDGKPCFRCVTVGTFAATNTVTGFKNFRCFTTATRAVGNTLVTKAYEFQIDPDTTSPKGIGQVRHNISLDLSQAGSRPITDDDEISIGLYLADITRLIGGKIFIDLDPGTTAGYAVTDETRNYYLYPFRAEDLQRYAFPLDATTQIQAGQPIIQARQIDQFNMGPVKTIRDPVTGAVVSYDQFLQYRAQVEQGLSQGSLFRGARQRLLQRYNEALGQAGQGGGLLTSPVLDSGEFQAGSGQEQWYQLRIKVGDLIRVGTDNSLSLKDSTSFMIQFTLSGTTATATRFSSVWIGGTYGPDSETDSDVLGNAYYYRYIGRNSITGETGLPSPPTRAGTIGRRQQRAISLSLHPDPQVDKLDIYRYGGTLQQWVYLASIANTGTPTFVDNTPDDYITSNPLLAFDHYPPVPTADLPRSGTCDVVGTRVTITGGFSLNLNYATGTEAIINGKTFLFYAQPESSTVVELTESAGTITGGTIELPNALIMGNPLPTVFGPFGQGFSGLFYFLLGDIKNPGVLYWTNGNDPNSVSDLNYLEITGPSEPLIGGCVYDGRPFVWTSDRMYQILPNFNAQPGQSAFTAQEVANSKGAWTNKTICVDTLIYFVGKDGIYESEGGQPRSITDEALYSLFPHDGQPGVSGNVGALTGIPPPDYSLSLFMALVPDGQYVRFIYQDPTREWNMLIWDKSQRRWFYDKYGDGGLRAIYADKGQTIYRLIGSTYNGAFCMQTGTLDINDPIEARVVTQAYDFGDSRSRKRWGDIMLDLDTDNAPVTVEVWVDNFSGIVSSTPLSTVDRNRLLIDLLSGDELLNVNLGLNIIHSGVDGNALILYEWQPSAVLKPVDTDLRASDWELSGGMGAKFLQGLLIEADTRGLQRQIQVEAADGGLIETLTITHDRQLVKPYSLNSPPIGHSFRVRPVDPGLDWRLFNIKFIWEPAPEEVTVWQTQSTSNDVCGWQTIREGYISYISNSDITFTVTIDGATQPSYTLPTSGGVFERKFYLPFLANKGKLITYRLQASDGFRLFKKDCCILVAPWGRTTEMIATNPFGGDSRANGAAI